MVSKIQVDKSKLNGIVSISGAKNSILKLLAASILTNEDIRIDNFPAELIDAEICIDILREIGKTIEVSQSRIVIKEIESLKKEVTVKENSIRTTLLILSSLLSRFGSGCVPSPGGCNIGQRKYDLHIYIWENMGAKIEEREGLIFGYAPSGLKGANIYLPIRSTGATETAILCSVLAEGETIIWNPHVRPEIIDLIEMLIKMGANIKVYGQESIRIKGVDCLTGTTHTVIPDNMEAITWLIGAMVTNGEVEIRNFPYEHLEVPLIFLRESGAKIFKLDDSIIVRGSNYYPFEISTGPYPGINSDMQPIFAVLAAKAKGVSKIVDLRFKNRFQYIEELKKMGLVATVEGDIIKIKGGNSLNGAEVTALDLRAGAALLLAGLIADGETIINDAWQILRGYDQLLNKLKFLGVNSVIN